MKSTSTPFRITALVVAFNFLFTSIGLPQNNPIPGIDIVVRKQPGGSAIKTVTDNKGGFTFRGLKAGKYTLSVTPPEPAKNVNTTLGNRKKISSRITNGPEGVKVVVAFVTSKDSGKQGEPITIEIPKDGLKITGIVASSDTPEDVTKFFRIEGHMGKSQALEDATVP